MRRLLSFVIITACMVYANPVALEIVSEFQVAPTSSEQIEIRYFEYPVEDTVSNDTIPLQNRLVITPPGTSIVDTPLDLPGMGYAIIDTSVLSGTFGLPDDTGFIQITYFGDLIDYPQAVPTPPIYCSAAKFHCWYWYVESFDIWYGLMTDWYIDPTPTFGQPNDDYPGCIVAGHVYDHDGEPLSNARVTATARVDFLSEDGGIISPPQYHQCCTTYTVSDGSFLTDSLLPWQYYVTAYSDGYTPDTQLTPWLKCAEPCTMDFFLLGIGEDEHKQTIARPYAFPNPFYTDLYIVLTEPAARINMYDITGKLCTTIDNKSLLKQIHIDCSYLPEGIYFLSVPGQRIKVIKL